MDIPFREGNLTDIYANQNVDPSLLLPHTVHRVTSCFLSTVVSKQNKCVTSEQKGLISYFFSSLPQQQRGHQVQCGAAKKQWSLQQQPGSLRDSLGRTSHQTLWDREHEWEINPCGVKPLGKNLHKPLNQPFDFWVSFLIQPILKGKKQ